MADPVQHEFPIRRNLKAVNIHLIGQIYITNRIQSSQLIICIHSHKKLAHFDAIDIQVPDHFSLGARTKIKVKLPMPFRKFGIHITLERTPLPVDQSFGLPKWDA